MKKVIVKGPITRYGLHPWVYSGNIYRVEDAKKGETVEVYNRSRKFLGSALYNPDSDIVLRFYSREKEPLDYPQIKERIIKAREKRIRANAGEEEEAYRVVYGEVDELPGLVVDKYGNGLVVQFSSYGMVKRKQIIIDALYDVFSPSFIYERSNKHAAKLEGIEPHQGLLLGEMPQEDWIVEINGLKFIVDVEKGQKTGLYLDQRKNWKELEPFVEEKDVLELFSYQGGFTLHFLRGRARRVYVVDSQERAIEMLKKNVQLNEFKLKRVVPFIEDVFRFLDEFGSAGIKFDLILIDPPSFARSQKTKQKGLKAYFNLLNMALQYLKDGGSFAIFSCSSYIKREDLLEVIEEVLNQNFRAFRIVKEFTQPYDHPVLTSFPESKYLTGFLMEEWL